MVQYFHQMMKPELHRAGILRAYWVVDTHGGAMFSVHWASGPARSSTHSHSYPTEGATLSQLLEKHTLSMRSSSSQLGLLKSNGCHSP